MRHADQWKPSKFVRRGGKLVANRDRSEVGVSSRLIVDLIAEFYEQALPQYARGRLLDLGCGKAPLYLVYRELAESVTCVDWANTRHKNPHLDLEHDLTRPLPLEDGAFDTIILSDVLEHLPEPERLWREMERVLGPGGRVILSVPFFYWLHETPHDFFRYTEFALRRFAEQAGLELLLLESRGGALDIIADVTAKLATQVPVIGGLVARSAQWEAGWFGRTGPGMRIRARTGRRFPLFYVLVAEKPV